MLNSIFKAAVRNLIRNRTYAAINILGLAIGIACCFLLLLHVQDQLSYDRFHQKHDRIFRVYERWHRPDGSSWTRSLTGVAVGWRLENEFPEIESVVTFLDRETLVDANGRKMYESGVFYVDSSIFDVFSFRLTRGDAGSALDDPHSLVLSQETARKYFGDEDPIGKVVTFENDFDMLVTGVLEDIPNNSHLKFDFLAPLGLLTTRYSGLKDHWDSGARAYLLLTPGSDPALLEDKLKSFVTKYRDEKTAAQLSYGLQPLADIHFNPTSVDAEDHGQASLIYVLAAAALFVLAIAVFNFVNLSTAMYASRVGEVSVRKVLGADRAQLQRQFIGESLVLVSLSVILSIALAELFLPVFRSLAHTELEISYVGNPLTLAGLVALTIIVTVAGGGYPAFVLSRLNPVDVLRRTMTSGRRGVFARRALVVFQFAISAGLILGAVVVHGQFRHLITTNLGYDPRNVMVVPMRAPDLSKDRILAMKEEAGRLPGVRNATLSSDNPCAGDVYGVTLHVPGHSEDISMPVIYADQDYLPALGLTLAAGRNFLTERSADERGALIVNEAAVSRWGENLNIGRELVVVGGGPPGTGSDGEATVIGVVENYNFRNLRDFRIGPVALLMNHDRMENLLVRIEDERQQETIAAMRNLYERFVPDRPFKYSFLEDDIRQEYRSEQLQSRFFGYSALLAVFVAVIGLFGLALYMTRRRTKEIGIRKVFGASRWRIVAMMAAEFALLVAMANLIAMPVGYYFLSDWLAGFSNRVSFSAAYFAVTILASLVFATLTVSYLSLRAASANPTDALRYE